MNTGKPVIVFLMLVTPQIWADDQMSPAWKEEVDGLVRLLMDRKKAVGMLVGIIKASICKGPGRC